jgi:cytochrome c oxidase subunit IV
VQRHDIDPVAVVAGVVFVLIAVGYAVDHAANLNLNWVLALPAGLIVVGAGILAIVARRIQRP